MCSQKLQTFSFENISEKISLKNSKCTKESHSLFKLCSVKTQVRVTSDGFRLPKIIQARNGLKVY